MPTLAILLGFRFWFYANEHEPKHVHVRKGDSTAKVQLYPTVEIVKYRGFSPSELKMIEAITVENCTIWVNRWDEYFRK